MCTPAKTATHPLLWSLARGLGMDPAVYPLHISHEATLKKMEILLQAPSCG